MKDVRKTARQFFSFVLKESDFQSGSFFKTFAQILKTSREVCFEFPVFFHRISTEKKESHRTACDSGCINRPANFRTRNFTLDKVSDRGM